jgi:sugar lactone lactonase YvrE
MKAPLEILRGPALRMLRMAVVLGVVWVAAACSVNSDDFGQSTADGTVAFVLEPEDLDVVEGSQDRAFELKVRFPSSLPQLVITWFECPPGLASGCRVVQRSEINRNIDIGRTLTIDDQFVPGPPLELDGYRYGAQVSYVGNVSGSITSRLATMTVRPAVPNIYNQPQSITRSIGEEAAFSVSALGLDPLLYQWQRNGVDIVGANARELGLGLARLDQNGERYRAVVTNIRGQAVSNEAVLQVRNELAPPTIRSPPVDLTAADRQSAAFGVFATGAPPLAYQWYRDGSALAGATGPSIELPTVTRADDDARFHVVVSNAAGTATSEAATLTVSDAALRLVRHAGAIAGAGNAGGDARDRARFDTPMGVARDGQGNVYVADTLNGVIRRITPSGLVSVLAGSLAEKGHRDGQGTEALFTAPVALAVRADTLYVADWNHTVRRITGASSGTPSVSTLAGQPGSPGAEDGIGDAARFNGPSGLALDPEGGLYVADEASHTIRRIDIGTRQVTTYAGHPFSAGSVDGERIEARFRGPRGLHMGVTDRLLVADTGNHQVRSIDRLGVVRTVAGQAQVAGLRDTAAAAANFSSPTFALQLADGIYVADSGNHVIRYVSEGRVSTVAGTGQPGNTDGQPLQARFNTPVALADADSGGLLVADLLNHAIRYVPGRTTALSITTLAGQPPRPGAQDGHWSVAGFRAPTGLAAAPGGGLWLADAGNHVIRRIDAGQVSTRAGQPGVAGQQDGPGPQASFNAPTGVAVDGAGHVWVAQSGAVRRIGSDGAVATVVQAAASSGLLATPRGIAIGPGGEAYVADPSTHRIVRVQLSGAVTALAGDGSDGHADGSGEGARLRAPEGIAYDPVSGILYVADTGNHVIRRIGLGGEVSTWVGAPGQPGSADGPGAAARLREPAALTVGRGGHVYVADRGNYTIRRITPAGEVATIAGQAGVSGFAPGPLPGLLARPTGIVVAGTSLFVTMTDGVVEMRDYP